MYIHFFIFFIFKIAPNTGYVLNTLKVNNSVISNTTSYTFENVTSDQTIEATFVVDNSAPGVPTVNVSSKTTSSFTVSAVATDVDGDNLTYSLYVDESLKYTTTGASGATVTFSAITGLAEYSTHSFYVTVNDGIATTIGSSTNVTTYCSVSGTYKCTASMSTVDCDYCNFGFTTNTSYMSSSCKNSSGWQANGTDYTDGGSYYCDVCHNLTTEVYDFYYKLSCCNNTASVATCSSCTTSYSLPTLAHKCTACNGAGSSKQCPTHGTSSTHCTHGRTSQH